MAEPNADSRAAGPEAARAVGGQDALVVARLQSLAHLVGLLVATVGVVVFVGGWLLGFARLRSVALTWPPTRVNASIMTVLGGLSLASLARTPLSRGRRLAGAAAAAAVCLIASLVLFEHVSGRDLGIDLLLIPRDLASYAPFGARVPLQSAMSFLLLGSALALLAKGSSLLDLLALGAAAICGAALLGYLHKAPALYQLPARDLPWGMAMPQAAALLVLAGGILCARPASGLMSIIASREAGGFMARRLIVVVALVFPAIALVVEAGWWAGWYSDRAASAMVLLLGIAAGSLGVLVTGKRLNETSTELRRALADASQWKHFFHRSSWGVLITAPDGEILGVNTAYARMARRAPEELVGKPAAEVFAPAERALLPERLLRADEHGHLTFDSNHVREDGSVFPVLVDTTAVKDNAGRILHVAFYVRSLTECAEVGPQLHEADEVTRRLKQRLDAATRAHLAISNAALSLRTQGTSYLLEVIVREARELTSARFGAIGFGVDPSRPFDPWIQSGVPPEQAAALDGVPHPTGTLRAAAYGDVVRTRDLRGHPEVLGFPVHDPSMSSLLGVPILDRGKNVGTLYVAGKRDAEEFTAEDQTLVEMVASRASTALETARLYESEARERAWLEAALEQVPEAVILVDAQGKLLLENSAARDLGCTQGPPDARGEPTPHDVRYVNGTPVPAAELPVYRALTRGEETRGLELTIRLPDGEVVPILASAAPVRVQGRVIGAVVAQHDIRKLKELERLREEWAAIVAHDLRQPLSVIALAAGMLPRLRAGDLTDQERTAHERLKKATHDLRKMIDDLLAASLIESKRLEVTPAVMDLDAVVSDVLASMPELAGHAVRHELVGRVSVWADRARVEQILRNLLSNAAKYGEPAGEIVVDVQSRDGWAETTVANRGPGLGPDEVAQLFQRFKRTVSSRASGATGIGLGLYVTKGLVEAQGGRIWVESTALETRFHFTLPIAAASSELGSPP
jgi:PAS domain S-box-containing protein